MSHPQQNPETEFRNAQSEPTGHAPRTSYENPAPGLPRAPSAQESPKGAKRKSKKAEGSSLSTAVSGTNSKTKWISKQQKLWKEQYQDYEGIQKPDQIWYKH